MQLKMSELWHKRFENLNYDSVIALSNMPITGVKFKNSEMLEYFIYQR